MLRKSRSGGGGIAGLEGGATLIARNTRLAGDVHFAEQIYVNGVIEGDVRADDSDSATLVVCEGGRVTGEIRVPNVVIDGTVEGDVYATGKLELAAKAKVLGNVHYNLVEMQLGSVVNGQMISLADQPTADTASGGHATLDAAVDAAVDETVTGIREHTGQV